MYSFAVSWAMISIALEKFFKFPLNVFCVTKKDGYNGWQCISGTLGKMFQLWMLGVKY